MAVERITKRLIDSLKPREKYYFVWDSELTGFGVRVWPTGRKTYLARYRMPGEGRRGTSKRISLGEHGTLAPDEARKLARKALGQVAHGLNPAAERSARRKAPTVNEMGAEYLKDVEAHAKKSTTREYRRLWNKHIFPALGSKQVATVELADIRKLHRSLAHTPYVANRVVARLASFFFFAEKEKARLAHTNPTQGLDFFPETERERFLTVAEYNALGAALAKAETEGLPPAPKKRRKPSTNPKAQKHRPKKNVEIPIPADPYAVAAIRLLALTGCRENEILSLRHDAVDFERGHLRLSDTKTGKSVRPLSAAAAEVIKTLPVIDGNPYVLPGRKEGEHLKNIDRLWHAVRVAAKLEDVRIHDLRHSYASVPASSGESMLVLRDLLGHKNVATTERYAHLGDDPVKRAANKASGDIAEWLGAQVAK